MGVSIILAIIVIIISCLTKRRKYGKYNLLDTWSHQYIQRWSIYILSLYHNYHAFWLWFLKYFVLTWFHVHPLSHVARPWALPITDDKRLTPCAKNGLTYFVQWYERSDGKLSLCMHTWLLIIACGWLLIVRVCTHKRLRLILVDATWEAGKMILPALRVSSTLKWLQAYW